MSKICTAPLSNLTRALVLSNLLADYHAHVEALIAKYPGQSRAAYMSRVAGVRIGRVRRMIRTKLGVAAVSGELVLVWPETAPIHPELAGSLTFWSTTNRVDTLTRSNTIEIVG